LRRLTAISCDVDFMEDFEGVNDTLVFWLCGLERLKDF
jgi:hypothetical protein